MEHKQVKEHATQRYFLDEMTEAERNEFEEHYFDCAICAADVRDTARLMVVGREIALQEKPVPLPERTAEIRDFRHKRPWSQWMPQAAAASIVSAFIGWYIATNSVPNSVPKVPVFESAAAQYDILMESERGPDDPPAQVSASRTVILNYTIPSSPDAVSYRASIRDAAGKTVYAEAVSLEQAAQPKSLVARALPRGNYQVVVEGVRKDGIRFPIAKSPFEVVLER